MSKTHAHCSASALPGSLQHVGSLTALLLLAASIATTAHAEPLQEPTAPNHHRQHIVGVLAVAPEDCPLVASYGAVVAGFVNPSDSRQLQHCFDAAKHSGLSILVKGPGKGTFSAEGGKIDFTKIERVLDNYFANNSLANDKSLAGLWLIDEPAHPGKYNLEAGDLKQLYETVNHYNPDIPLMINFGDLGAFEHFMKSAKPGWKFADIVMFTVTRKKIDRHEDYVKQQAAIAKRIASFDPELKIIPAIAVVEFKRKHGTLAEIPSAQWVKRVSMQCIDQDAFSGILLYPFSRKARWIGRNIKDVKDDPAYSRAFEHIFAAAASRADAACSAATRNSAASCSAPAAADIRLPLPPSLSWSAARE